MSEQAKNLLAYSLLICLTVWTLVTWIPLAIQGSITIIEPSVGIRFMELGLLILVLGFAVGRYISWIKSRRLR